MVPIESQANMSSSGGATKFQAKEPDEYAGKTDKWVDVMDAELSQGELDASYQSCQQNSNGSSQDLDRQDQTKTDYSVDAPLRAQGIPTGYFKPNHVVVVHGDSYCPYCVVSDRIEKNMLQYNVQ